MKIPKLSLIALAVGTGLFIAILIAVYILVLQPNRLPSESRLTVVAGGNPASLDPLRLVDVVSGMFVAAVHTPLALVDSDGEIVPVLAQSIEMSPDALTCTVQLRQAHFWDDAATPVRAQDVAYSFRRIQSHPQASLIFSRLKEEPDAYEVIDDRTLVIRFREPDPEFVYLIASNICSIVMDGSGDLSRQEFDLQIIGAGPYKPERVRPGQSFEFSRNEGFPIELPFAHAEIRIIEFERAQVDAISQGTADMVRVRGPLLNEIVVRSDDNSLHLRNRFINANLVSAKANELVVLFLPSESGKLSELDLDERKALHQTLYHGLDRESLLSQVYLGLGEPAYGVVPSMYGGPRDAVIPESAVADRISGLTVLAANDADSRRLTEFVRGSARAVGIDMEPVFVDLATLAERLIAGEGADLGLVWFEMNISAPGPLPWAIFFTPDSPFTVLGEAMDGLDVRIHQVRSILEDDARAAAYREIFQDVSKQQSAWIPLISRNATWLTSDRVASDFLDVNGNLQFSFVRVSTMDLGNDVFME